MTLLLVFLIQHQRKRDKLNVRKIKKSEIKLCITIGIITIFFFAVNSPLTVVYLLEGFYTDMPSSRLIRNSSYLFAGINSMINPFIYLFRIKYFRDLLRKSINQIRSSVFPENMWWRAYKIASTAQFYYLKRNDTFNNWPYVFILFIGKTVFCLLDVFLLYLTVICWLIVVHCIPTFICFCEERKTTTWVENMNFRYHNC